jgi:membrane fusion protein (multidrug efflux system)
MAIEVKRTWIIAAAVVVLGVGGFWLWRVLVPRESTDDAQVAGHVSPIAARVGGTVKAIRVQDNQTVKAGDVLVEIDKRDYEIAVARAEADLAAAQAASRAAHAGVPVTSETARSEQHSANAGADNAEAAVHAAEREVDASRAKLTSAKARLVEVTTNATRTTQDLERLRPLAAKEEISKQQFDAATAAARAAEAAVDSATAAVHEAEANLDVAEAHRVQAAGGLTQARAQAQAASTAPQQIALTQAHAAGADAQVQQAQATLDQARVNLERTTIIAPADGVVSRRSVELGQVIQAGQPLMAITSLGDVWVVANFKETQLARMRVGQHAEIEVDGYGGRSFSGHVDSIAAATGATFSLLPPDNATGNFVKVVQRIPVKILLDDARDANTPLRPGMSVDATVYLK